MNLFSEKYIGIFNPFNLESIEQLSVFLKQKNNHLSFVELRTITLDSLKYLLQKEIVYVLEQDWMSNKEFNKTHLSNHEVLKKINGFWTPETSWDEFYDLLWFKFQDWYIVGLTDLGLSAYELDWNGFIKNKIGDLEQWIEDNRPEKN